MKHVPYIAPMSLIAVIVILSVFFEHTASTKALLFMHGWYDKIQHFTAGLVCGIFGVWCVTLYDRRKYEHPPLPTRLTLILSAGCAALLIGGLWEVYEHLFQVVLHTEHSYVSLDTILDMICDVTGAIVASTFYYRTEVARE